MGAPLIADERSAISGENAANPPPPLSTIYLGPNRSKGRPILAHFSKPDSGLEMNRQMGDSKPRLWSEMRTPLIVDECSAICGGPGKIMVNPPPHRATLFPGPSRGEECPDFGTF